MGTSQWHKQKTFDSEENDVSRVEAHRSLTQGKFHYFQEKPETRTPNVAFPAARRRN